jgi:hypothetical protein
MQKIQFCEMLQIEKMEVIFFGSHFQRFETQSM